MSKARKKDDPLLDDEEDMIRIRDRMNKARQLLRVQEDIDDVKYDICNTINKIRFSTPKLSEYIEGDIKEQYPSVYEYIRKLERLNATIQAPEPEEEQQEEEEEEEMEDIIEVNNEDENYYDSIDMIK
jgi:hypothetical protein